MPSPKFDQLPAEYQYLLQLAKEDYQLDVAPLAELKGGRTGAFLYLVSALVGDSQHLEHFILKFDHISETARQTEKERHHQAWSQAPEAFANQHMAKLAYELEHERAVALFYTVAGQSLQNFHPLAAQEQQSRLEKLFGATNKYLLQEWNAAAVFEQAVHPQKLLEKWLGYRLKADGRIPAFIKNIFHLDPGTEGFLIQGQVFPNPFIYGLDATRWKNARPIDVLTGFQHGDLNIANILARFSEETEELDGYFLIDFALFKPRMPLLYDQRYLEMSYLLRELNRAPFQKWISLVTQFSNRDILSSKEAPVELAGICEVFNSTRRSFKQWIDTYHPSVSDDLWGQYWLGAAAAGLNFCNKSGLSTQEKLAGLIYASVHLKRYFVQFGILLPAEVRLLYDANRSEVPSSNQAPPTESPSTSSPADLRHNLPTQLTSFIGRKKEVAEIKDLLNSARLVTLTGAGGSGKTRLTIEVGLDELPSYPDGVQIIELAPLTDPAQVVPAIAQIFGLQELPFTSIESVVVDYLRVKKILLIFDNCEHLIEACAHLAADLLHQCTQLKLLASSREALNIAGEVIYHTPTLANTEAMHLFEERARASNPKFILTDTNSLSVSQICSRLDGIPLAIELAAARVKLLSPEQIAARLGDRFRLLVGGDRTALPRQQTLRALINWSYDLLSEEEKHLLRTASVFVGGWSLEALEAIAEDPDVMEHLEELINKSLVMTEERPSEMRYFMLETIRQYAKEKLIEAKHVSEICERHFFYYDALSEKMWQAFLSTDLMAWRDTVDDESENLRAAVEWGMQHHTESALHLAASYCIVSSLTGNQAEGLALLKSVIDRFRTLPLTEGEANVQRQRVLSRALFAQALVGVTSAAVPQGMQALQEAISIARQIDDKQILGYCLELTYTGSDFISSAHSAEAEAKEGFTILSEINDQWGLSLAYANLTRIALAHNNELDAQKYIAQLRIVMESAPMSYQTGIAFLSIGSQERWARLENAKEYYEQALKIFRHLRHKSFETIVMSELGHVARAGGNITEAKDLYKQSLRRFQDQGHRPAIAHQLECFAFIAMAEKEPERAAKLFGAAQALRERISAQMQDLEEIEYENALVRLHFLLNEADFNSLWAQGRGLTMEQAIQFALS
jgi:non-specific serine/threonine protein kinase